MRVGSPPLEIGEQVWRLLGRGPGATSQRGYSVSDGQIHPLNKGRVQSSRETQSLQCADESVLCVKAHHRRDAN
jgi:hypothetical protein